MQHFATDDQLNLFRLPAGWQVRTSPAHQTFVQVGREPRKIISELPCSRRKQNADLEKYNSTS